MPDLGKKLTALNDEGKMADSSTMRESKGNPLCGVSRTEKV